MFTFDQTRMPVGNKRSMLWCLCFIVMMTLLTPFTALCAPERLVESRDYKDKDFVKGCIGDYSDIVAYWWNASAPNDLLYGTFLNRKMEKILKVNSKV